MLDYDKTLSDKLETIGIPVYYEDIVDSSVETPCITYFPASNTDYLVGDTLFYSRIEYYVKVWGHFKKELMPYMEQLATLMRELGFRRESYHELASDTQLCLVALYRATGYEKEM